MVDRVYDLGQDGEEVAHRLLAAIRLGNHLEPVFVLTRFPQALAELFRRVEEAAPRFDLLKPGPDVAEKVIELAGKDLDPSIRRVLWIETDPFDVQSWKAALATLNQRREWLRAKAPWLIVLAGPLAEGAENLHNLAGRHAPDFFSIATTLLVRDEPRLAPPPPSRPLQWLHLSDFHFSALESWDRSRILKALLAFLAKKKATGWKPDFVFATGDIAWSGKEKEYEQAIFFFRELAKTLDLDLPSQLFLIPGNHDVDRSQIKRTENYALDGLLNERGTEQQEQIAALLKDAPTLRPLGRRLEAYYTFTERLLGSARRTINDKPWRVDFRDAAGIEVAILQLNSAWASGRNEEKGKLLVGVHQLEEALGEAERSRLRFVLIHHPLDYLADGDTVAIKSRLKARGGGHFFLRGHLHATEIELSVNPDGRLAELAAGAVYAGTKWPKRFLIGEADLAKGQATIDFFTYSDSGAGYWTVDPLSYQESKDGSFTFPLPSELKLSPGKSAGDNKGKKARHRTAIARYRAAVTAVHGQMRFVGFPAATGQRPNVAVRDLFVPLRLSVHEQRGHEKKESLSTSELLAGLAPGGDKASRFVILGEPGSGKTTLCRFAAVAFSGETLPVADAATAQVATPGNADLQLGQAPPKNKRAQEPLALFLPFRDYVRRCRDAGECSLIEYIVDQAHTHLQVGSVDAAMLGAALADGSAILLLDGLDEVGNEVERTEMRDRIVAFCDQYPRLPVLLTSRYAGYDQAPLPDNLFRRLELKPFEDEDLRVFVTNWYAVQEPSDPVARERGVADLLAALATEPRVRALAGNPLLATLIALVHRTEAKLPGERAKLYELCVRTLLETWPWQAQRRFSEIDEGLQRSYLEEFALRQQEKRSDTFAEVAFERAELVASLTEVVARGQSQAPRERVRRLVEQWIEYLAAGTGIIVEQRPGVFAFVHLSLLEYLAACALDHQEESPESRIARLQIDPIWQEVLLLAVGRRATDLPFLDRLWERLKQTKENDFLLRCLREEAAFSDERRSAILDASARRLLEQAPDHWDITENVVRTIERFSVRHGEKTREWRRVRLATSRGEELRSVVALSLGQSKECESLLKKRRDRDRAAADLLEYWPGSFPGDWAVTNAGPSAIGSLFRDSAAELCSIRALAAMAEATPASVACAIASRAVRGVATICSFAQLSAERLQSAKRSLGRGLPSKIQVSGLHTSLSVIPRLAWKKRNLNEIRPSAVVESPANYFSLLHLRKTLQAVVGETDTLCVSDMMEDLSVHYPMDSEFSPPDYLRLVFDVPMGDLGHLLTHTFLVKFAAVFSSQFSGEFMIEAAAGSELGKFEDFLVELIETGEVPEAKPDSRGSYPLNVASLESCFDERSITIRRAAEAWIAAVTSVRASIAEAHAYSIYRLQNIALIFFWPAMDQELPIDPEPEKLALYLQLGWTQSTTTYEWPATERWISIMNAGPPAHWMPRAQWHLCWLLHDNQDAEHQRAFNEAMREGLADTDLGRHAVAETLEQVIGFYP